MAATMSDKYQVALQRWGAGKLARKFGRKVGHELVSVSFEFDDGWGGCESCAESPSAGVDIWDGAALLSMRIEVGDFDFATVLREILEGDGKDG